MECRRCSLWSSLALFVGVVLGSPADAGEGGDNLGRLCSEAIGWRTRISYRAISTSQPPRGGPDMGWDLEIVRTEVLRSGVWGDVTRTSEYVRGHSPAMGRAEVFARTRSIWCPEGQLLLVGDTARPFDSATLYEPPGLALADYLADPAAGAVLDGVAYGWDGRGLDELVAAAPSGQLRLSALDSHTIIISGLVEGAAIEIEMAVQPRELRRYQVEWGAGSPFRGRPIEAWGLAWVRLSVVNDEFEPLGSSHPARKGVVQYSFAEVGGASEFREYLIERSHFDLEPDTSGLSSCSTGLPEGFLINSPSHPQVSLEWRGGRIQPRVPLDAFARMGELVSRSRSATLHLAAGVESGSTGLQDRPSAAVAAPYCGVLCAYGMGLMMSAHQPDPVRLVCDRFIGSLRGSTAAELVAALADMGVDGAEARCPVTVAEAFDGTPRILLVRATTDAQRADHFVLVTGRVGLVVEVVDPATDGVRSSLWSPEYLPRIWDGVAIEAPQRSGASKSQRGFFGVASVGFAVLIAGVAGAAAGVLHCIGPDRRHAGSARTVLGQGFAVIAVSALVALSFHLAPSRLNSSPQQALVDASAGVVGLAALPEVDADTVRLVSGHSAACLLDARYGRDYRLSHIPGAHSVPPGSTDQLLASTLCDVRRDCLMIVYCQSDECGYADQLAARLLLLGYRNLAVFRAGMDGWRSTEALNP